MLKRLLTAVLVLGLIVAFSGTAFTAPTDMPGDKDFKVITGRTTAVEESRIIAKAVTTPEPLDARLAVTQRPHMQAQMSPDTTTCDITNYASYEDGYFNPFVSRSSHATRFGFGMRYDGPNKPGFAVMVNGVHAWLLRVAEDPAFADGLASMKVTVNTDIAGIPGTEVYSEVFALPVHGDDYVSYTSMMFTNPPIVYGAYHITMWADPAGPGTDTIIICSDDAGFPPANPDPGTGRSSINYTGTWMSMYDFWFSLYPGFNPDFDWYADWCQVYSECRWELGGGFTGGASVFSMPRVAAAYLGAVRNGIGQRFVTDGGPDTVKTIDIIHYDFNAGAYSGTSTNGLIIQIWDDDGAGSIDLTAGPMHTFTLPGGTYLFPQTGAAAAGWNEYFFTPPTPVVVLGAWHLTIQASTDDPTLGTFFFNGSNTANDGLFAGGSVRFSAPYPGTEWTRTNAMVTPYFTFGEMAWLTQIELCKDEFALCNTAATYFGLTTGYYGGIPGSGYSRQAWAHLIAGTGLATRVDKFRVLLGDETVFGGTPADNGTPEVDMTIRAAVAGAPGPVLYSQHFTEAQIGYYPGWTEVVIPGGLQVGPNDFFVCVELAPPTTTADYIYFMAEAPAATLYNGGAWQIWNTDMMWHPRTDFGDAVNGIFEVEYCSVPPSRWTCATPSDFMNAGADFARTAHTNVALTDAYCDLSFKWKFFDPLYNVATNRIVNSGPVVFDTIVACGFSSRYRFFNLKDGSVIGEIAGPTAPYYLPTTGINCTPTIAMVTVGGTPKPIMFAGHGNSAGFRVFDAYDLSSWSGTAPTAVPAQLWSVNQTNYAAHGYVFPTGYPIHLGATNYTNPIVMNLGGTECVIFNTNDQYIWAAVAETGDRFTGWAGPIIVNGLTYKGLATDGVKLYITNTALLPAYPLGDITAWDAATGASVWKLSTSGGLQGAGDMPDFGNETFVSGLALYQDKEVYAVSSTPEVDDPSGQYGGLLYRIKASDGAVLSTTPTEHRRQDGGLALIGGIMVDAATIVVPGSSRWANSVNAGQLFGYNRFTGGLNWVVSEGAYDADAGHFHDGLLTCEAGDTDLGFITNTNGYLSCFNPTTGDEYFSRRFNNLANLGGALAISAGGELLVADRQGALYCLSKTMLDGVTPVADRPRLEIIDHTPQGNTYGPLPSVIVTIENVYTNTGCAPLTGTIYLEDASNGSTLGPVAGSGVRPMDIADRLTQGSSKLAHMYLPDPGTEEYASSVASRPALNRAASAIPDFFNVGTLPVNLLPGDTGDFVMDVKQSMVFRGENVFFAYFQTNDPDYFLDSLILAPQVRGQIIGGCLLDTARLFFGAGGTNWQDVLNVPRYGHYGDTDDNWYMEISGDEDDFYGGFEVYGVSKERIAMNTQDWWSGNGEARAYKALQGDPNQCNTNCKPALLSAQTFGMITADGSAYTPLVGNMVCATFLDSVQMWAPLDTLGNYGTWNWNTTWLTAGTYNNDSTMGLITQRRSIGFTGFPAAMPYLGQVVIDFNKIYFRYPGGGPLNGWRAGEHVDYDLGGDTVLHFPTFASYSTAATVPTLTSRPAGTWGTMKLPYGGGCNSVTYPTLVNARSMHGDMSMNEQTQRGNAYLDSVYFYMGRPAGTYSAGPMRTAPSDQRSHDTWITHDFADDLDTLQFAIAHFGDPALANPFDVNSMVAPLSKTLNKWVGMDRGDVNNDGALNLADIIYLADYVGTGQFGPIPFATVGDVDVSGVTDGGDVNYLVNYYFYYGPCPMSEYVEPFTW